MSRLLALLCVAMFLDTLFAAVIAPLLPHYEDEIGITKAGAGILTGAYPGGTFLIAVPAVWLVGRYGARRIVQVGLAALAVTTVVFSVSRSLELLVASRALQGVGAGLIWGAGFAWVTQSTPESERGAALGTIFAAAVAGSLLGPVLGGISTATGPLAAFGVIGAVAAVMAVVLGRDPTPDRAPATTTRLSGASVRAALPGTWLVLLFGVAIGVVGVLAPLRLADLGAGTFAVGLVFALAAGVSIVVSPFAGRVSDRRGPALPVTVALLCAAPVLVLQPVPGSAVAVGVLVVLGAAALGPLWPLGAAMLSAELDRARAAPAIAAAAANVAWGAGELAGAAGGGAGAEVWSDRGVYVLLGAACLLTLGVLQLQRWSSRTWPSGSRA